MTWKEKSDEYWHSLREENPIDKKKRDWLASHVNLLADDVTLMSQEELEENFQHPPHKDGTPRPGVNDAKLTRTHIYQAWCKIRAGEMQPLKGNLRSYWYREYEPFYVGTGRLTHHWTDPKEPKDAAVVHGLPEPPRWEELMLQSVMEGVKSLGKKQQRAVKWMNSANGRPTYLLNLMTGSFDDFVIHHIFNFDDEFQFEDPRKNFRVIGKDRARIVLCTEKEGLWQLVKGFAQKKGISGFASHGESHWLSMYYLAEELQKAGVKKLFIGAVTDYDPWGYVIAGNFAEKFEQFGFKVELTRLTNLGMFTPAQIAKGKRDFSDLKGKGKKKQADDWYKETKGIHGERAAIHVDLADWPVIEEYVQKWYDKVTGGKKKPGKGSASGAGRSAKRKPVSKPGRKPAAGPKAAGKAGGKRVAGRTQGRKRS